MKRMMGVFALLFATGLFTVAPIAPADASDQLFPGERLTCNFKCQEIPGPNEVLRGFGRASSGELLRPQLSVLVWNVYKGRKEYFLRDFGRLAPSRDIVMLSEATEAANVKSGLERLPFSWTYAVQFFMKDMIGTGQVTGSYAQPSWVGYTRTEDLEPFVKSPKVILMTKYLHRPSRQEILFLNIHGINWVSTAAFERQIRSVEPAIAAHRGPILFAGDFNIHNPDRLAVLYKVLRPYGMDRAPWENPPTEKQYDDAFLRGFKIVRARYLHGVKGISSDHPALDLELVP